MGNKYIDSFTEGCQLILEQFGIKTESGSVVLRKSPFGASATIVVIGIVGDLHGQCMLSIEEDTACFIASKMMGDMDVVMDEVTKSAIAELTNMMVGNAVTILSQKNVMLDITPPSVLTGNNIHISTSSASLSIPFLLDGKYNMEFCISAKELKQ